MCNCLPLVASLPGIIIICGLTALFCIVFFDTTPAHGQKKTVKKFREPGKIKCDYIHNVTANPNAPQEAIEFDVDDFLVKVEKISPVHNECPEIFPKEQFMPGSKAWQVQLMTDAQEDRSSEEKSYVLTCQYLQNTLRIFLEIISGTSHKRGDVRSTTISKNRKSK